MASDLPDSFSSSTQMARALASYMTNPYAVRRAVLENFRGSPSIIEIRNMRSSHLARKNAPPELYPAVTPYSARAEAEALDYPNARFLAALERAYPERFAAMAEAS